MKKSGFTLIELLAVIVIIGIIALISTPVVLNIINESKKETFKNSVLNAFKATELYEVKNDFEKISNDGINITDESLPLENGIFTSGKIIRNINDKLEVVNVTDGTYCAKGIKDNIVVIKGSCDEFDETAPINTTITMSNVTSNSIKVIVNSIDDESGIKNYSYSIDGTNFLTTTSNNYTFNNLAMNKEYVVYVRVTNNNGITTEIITEQVKTKEINEPTYSIDKTGWQTSKTVTITYPERETGFVYTYSVDGGESWILVLGETTNTVTFTSNGNIIARIYDGKNYKTASTYSVTGIDTTEPSASLTLSNKTTNKITVLATALDNESGIKNYEFKINSGTYVSNGTNSSYTFNNVTTAIHGIKVRVTNGSGLITESEELVVSPKEINEPTYSINESGWKPSKIVTITYPERETGFLYSYSIDGGSSWITVENETTANVTFTSNGNVIARVYDGTNYKSASSYTVNQIDATAPSANVSLSSKTTNTITVKATALDNESGVTKYEFSIDNGTYINNGTNDTYAFIGVTEGNHTVRVRVTNGSGLTTESMTLTASPNEITLPIYGIDKTGWQTNKTVTIAYPEKETGFVYSYSIDGGYSWATVSTGTTANVTFTSNGNVIARIYDGTNYKTASSYSVTQIDTTAPVVSVVYKKEDGTPYTSDTWTNQSVIVTLSATETQSGVAKYQVTYEGTYFHDVIGDTLTYSGPRTGIWFRAIDNAGNIGPQTSTYLIAVDKTPPAAPSIPDLITEHDTGSSNTDNVTMWWYNLKVTGTAEANSTIHIRNVSVSMDIIAIASVNASGYWEANINTTQNAWSNIYVYSVDAAGNWTVQPTPLSIYSDTTPPAVPNITYNGGANTAVWKNNYNLTFSSTDSTGIWKYQTDHNMDSVIDREIGSNFIPENGYSTATDRYRAVDVAGNVSGWTAPQNIFMDTENPVHNEWWWGSVTSNGASLYIRTTDAISGINRVQCPTSTESTGYSNWQWFNAVWDASANAYRCDITSSTFNHYGQTYITHLYIWDNAGNGGYYNQTSMYVPPKNINLNFDSYNDITNNFDLLYRVAYPNTPPTLTYDNGTALFAAPIYDNWISMQLKPVPTGIKNIEFSLGIWIANNGFLVNNFYLLFNDNTTIYFYLKHRSNSTDYAQYLPASSSLTHNFVVKNNIDGSIANLGGNVADGYITYNISVNESNVLTMTSSAGHTYSYNIGNRKLTSIVLSPTEQWWGQATTARLDWFKYTKY